ncbi:MAG: LuxR C-terminal-related transcriptional regulator [Ruminococcus sp.]|nr:LuxR C-terminal-related transcriptional regulator [Ruminococcus sp.]
MSPTEFSAFNFCIQGLSYRAAAEKLGITEKSVDNAMQRARRKIRALMRL